MPTLLAFHRRAAPTWLEPSLTRRCASSKRTRPSVAHPLNLASTLPRLHPVESKGHDSSAPEPPLQRQASRKQRVWSPRVPHSATTHSRLAAHMGGIITRIARRSMCCRSRWMNRSARCDSCACAVRADDRQPVATIDRPQLQHEQDAHTAERPPRRSQRRLQLADVDSRRAVALSSLP